jgi:hypothetical protein
MEDLRFADLMRRERERLNREREEILHQQKELENKLNEINRELAGINAYEAAKIGKAVTPSRQRRIPEQSGSSPGSHLRRFLLVPRVQAGERRCCK